MLITLNVVIFTTFCGVDKFGSCMDNSNDYYYCYCVYFCLLLFIFVLKNSNNYYYYYLSNHALNRILSIIGQYRFQRSIQLHIPDLLLSILFYLSPDVSIVHRQLPSATIHSKIYNNTVLLWYILEGHSLHFRNNSYF